MISPTVEQLSQQLGEHPLFRTLDSPALERLLRTARVEKLSRHDVLYEPDDRAEKVVLVLSGVVKTTARLEGGREIILNLFGPGDLVGDEAVSQERRRAGASVLRDAVVALFPSGAVQALWARHSDFADAWINHLFQARLRLEARITELAYGNIEDRLMRMLMHLSEHHGTKTNGCWMMSFPLTHQELASLIGATRETTTLAVGRLRSTGRIEFKERKIVLLNGPLTDAHTEKKAG